MFIKSLKVSKYFKNNPTFPCIDYASIHFSKNFSKLQNTYLWLFVFEIFAFQNVQNNIIYQIINFGKNIYCIQILFFLLFFIFFRLLNVSYLDFYILNFLLHYITIIIFTLYRLLLLIYIYTTSHNTHFARTS